MEREKMIRILLDSVDSLLEQGIIKSWEYGDLKEYVLNVNTGKDKWHDIRKDPEDLPGESGWYDCVLENHEEDDYYTAFYFDSDIGEFGYWRKIFDGTTLGLVDEVFDTMDDMQYEKVIAWKQVDYFMPEDKDGEERENIDC